MRPELPADHAVIRRANEDYHRFVAADYEAAHPAVFDPASPVCRRLRHHVQELSRRHPGGVYLDVGCGTGALLDFARPLFSHVVGIDVSESMMAQALARGLSVSKGDMVALPFPEGTFDAVSCMSVLHHLVEPQAALREMVRVLKPGGSLVTDHDPNRDFLLKWPTVNRVFRMFFRHEDYVGDTFAAKQAMDPEQWKTIEQRAEYHAGPGMSPQELASALRVAGCAEARVEYHVLGDLPGPALRVVMALGMERVPSVLAPYFALHGTKA